jgi:hypothetical protein
MARAERTAYRLLKQNFIPRELFVIFSPSDREIAWAQEHTRNLRLCLLINLKIFQYLGYFPPYDDIPEDIVAHIRDYVGANKTVSEIYPNSRTLYRHRQLIHDFMQVLPWGKNALHLAIQKAAKLAGIMDNSTDLINALIEMLRAPSFQYTGATNTQSKKFGQQADICRY